MKTNHIHGRKLEFGNGEQIKYLRAKERVVSGLDPVATITWSFCQSSGGTHENGCPKYMYCDHKEADTVVNNLICPVCDKTICLMIHFDPQSNWQEELMMIDDSCKEFYCDKCGTEFFTDEDRNVFVHQDKD